MRIIVLDSSPANDGDLSWKDLEALGTLTVYDSTTPEQVVERCRDAEAVFSNKVVMDAAVIAALPHLRFIGVLATGYNNIDLEAARRAGVTVCNVPAYSTDSVAQLVFALLLEITNRVADYSHSVKRGDWAKCPSFSYRIAPISELSGKTMGIIGFGNIGLRVATIARAFGMTVLTTSRRNLPEWAERVKLDELLSRSHVVSLNSALTPATYHIINEETLMLMRPDAILINTSRGALVDEDALAAALEHGQIAAAAVDVLEEEPPRSGSPLIDTAQSVITPHVAWQSTEARRRLLAISVENLRAFLAGQPQNVVS
ncbi:MAG: D-2-hydroxyacid dehydrogenase [Lepagella sp.]